MFTLYFAIGYFLPDVTHDIGEGTLPAFFYRRSALVKQTVKFELSIKHLKGFDAHDHEIASAILGDEDRFTAFVTECGYFVVVVSQICAGLNVRHEINPPIQSTDIIPEFL
jgi:hypothetical protein